MERPQRLPLPVLVAAALLLAGLLLVGPAAGRSEAAQCGGSSNPAYKMSTKAASKATLCLLNKERTSPRPEAAPLRR